MSNTIGAFEQQILLALMHLGSDAYGVTIREAIEERTGRPISAGALYTALDRLEKRGLVLTAAYDSLQLMAAGLKARLKALRG
jgi:DNA-binding PadR family transcriptional regulator